MAGELVLVTGGSGFLGAHCIAGLLKLGYRVRTTTRSAVRQPETLAMLERAGADPANRLEFFLADLLSDEGWQDAVQGCTYVLHVASPFPENQPGDPNALIVPAVEGTLRVMRAASGAGVRRLVLTSSFSAIGYGHPPRRKPFTEADWTNLNADVTPYIRSKTLAERAAWDFIASEDTEMELSVINPVAIFGPVLGPDYSSSIGFISMMLEGRVPFVPKLMFGAVDVRDVTDLHIRAMTMPQAAGERFLAVAGDLMFARDIAQALKDGLGQAASRVSTREVPDRLIRIAGFFNRNVRLAAVPELGRIKSASSAKAQNLLGWQPRSREEAIVASGRSLIELGLIGSSKPSARA